MNLVPSLATLSNDPFDKLDNQVMCNLSNCIHTTELYRRPSPNKPIMQMMHHVAEICQRRSNAKPNVIHVGLRFMNGFRCHYLKPETVEETLAWLRANPLATEMAGGWFSIRSDPASPSTYGAET